MSFYHKTVGHTFEQFWPFRNHKFLCLPRYPVWFGCLSNCSSCHCLLDLFMAPSLCLLRLPACLPPCVCCRLLRSARSLLTARQLARPAAHLSTSPVCKGKELSGWVCVLCSEAVRESHSIPSSAFCGPAILLLPILLLQFASASSMSKWLRWCCSTLLSVVRFSSNGSNSSF